MSNDSSKPAAPFAWTVSPFRADLFSAPEVPPTARHVAIVTGGGTGIGRAIARSLSRCGARLAICGRRPEPLRETAAELIAAGGECLEKTCDIREPTQIAEFVAAVLGRYGRIDILINNAGGQRPYPASHLPLEHFAQLRLDCAGPVIGAVGPGRQRVAGCDRGDHRGRCAPVVVTAETDGVWRHRRDDATCNQGSLGGVLQ